MRTQGSPWDWKSVASFVIYIYIYRSGMDELQTLELSITELEEATADATAGAIEAEDPQYIC